MDGIQQARPPVETQFRLNGVNMPFLFYTWHAKATQALAQNSVAAFYRAVNHNQRWILAGDLNVQRTGLQGAVDDARSLVPRLPQLNDNQELHHYDDSLDFIITDQREQARNFIRDDTTSRMRDFWNRLFSDAHYALFANINFGRGS